VLSLAGRDEGATTVAFAPSVSIFTASVTTCPSVKVNIPFAVIGVFNVMAVTGKVLFIVRLLNVVVEEPNICCAAVPLNVTVHELAVKVPLFVQLPPNVILRAFAFNVPELMVTLFFTVNEFVASCAVTATPLLTTKL